MSALEDVATSVPRPGLRRRLLTRWRQLPAYRCRTDPVRTTLAERTVISVIALAALVALLPIQILSGSVGAVWCWALLQVLPGLAVCVWVPQISRVGFWLYTIVGSAAIDVAIGMWLVRVGPWVPVGAQVVVCSLCGLSLAARIVTARRGTNASRRLHAPSRETVGIVLSAVVGLALVALGTSRDVLPPRVGLIGVVDPAWWIGVILLGISAVVAACRSGRLMVPALALMALVPVSQALAYAEPVVTATAGHVGVVESLLTAHGAKPGQDIYQAWTGMFAAQAWTGVHVPDWFALATWWPTYAQVAQLLAVRILAARFLDVRRAWFVAVIFMLADGLNVAYFSPQYYAVAPAFAIICLLLGRAPQQRALALGRVAAIIGLSGLIIVTHQLTPYILFCQLAMLVIWKVIRPWWAPVLLLVASAVWAVVNAAVLTKYVTPGAFGNLLANIAPPAHGTPALPPQRAMQIWLAVPAAALLVIGIAGLIALIQHRRERWAWALASASVGPVFVAFGTDYGGEGIFRILLFALPWLSMLALRVRLPQRWPWAHRAARTRTVRIGATSLACFGLIAAFLVAQTGMDWARAIRPGTAQAERTFERTAPDGSVLFSVGTGRVTPGGQTARYNDFHYYSREDLAEGLSTGFPTTVGAAYHPSADIAWWTARVLKMPGSAHYVFFSQEMAAAGQRYRNQRYEDYMRLWSAMSDARGWKLVTRTDTAALYEWVGSSGS